jgi:hypothetical protein
MQNGIYDGAGNTKAGRNDCGLRACLVSFVRKGFDQCFETGKVSRCVAFASHDGEFPVAFVVGDEM